MKELTDGIKNWKLRLILSALLCIMGLSAMISMIAGIFIDLTVYDKSIVAIAIFMVGIPTYLILSGLAHIDEKTIANFLEEEVDELKGKSGVLIKDQSDLSDEEQEMRQKLKRLFDETPVYRLLPDKPVKQAYILLLFSMFVSFGIWYFS
jgi:hypothetical protein